MSSLNVANAAERRARAQLVALQGELLTAAEKRRLGNAIREIKAAGDRVQALYDKTVSVTLED